MNPINQDPNAQYLVYTNQNAAGQPTEKKKKHGCLIAFLIVLGLFIVGGAVLSPFVIKEITYMSAELFIEEDEYENALMMFESLGSYKDSEERIIATQYLQAQYFAENEEYEYAIEVLQEITPYEDSEELLGEYIAGHMAVLAENEDFSDLEDYLEIASDIDSDELEEVCAYYEAVLAYNDGDYEEAAEVFLDFEDYENAEKYYAMAAHKYYEQSYEMVDSDETPKSLFAKLEEYKDDKEINAMLCSNVYNSVKLYGEWECETGETLVFTDERISIDIPVKMSNNKNYYVVTSGDYVVAVEVGTTNIIPLFEIVSFEEPDESQPDVLNIINSADEKEYTFTRVK